MAKNIVFNGKTSRPSVCNALETLLVHKDIAETLPVIKAELDKKNVEIRGCDRTKQILGDCVVTATEEDYRIEFLDYIIAVKVVDSLDDAIAHIQKYSTGHSECIVVQATTTVQTSSRHEFGSLRLHANSYFLALPTAENSDSVQKSEFQPEAPRKRTYGT